MDNLKSNVTYHTSRILNQEEIRDILLSLSTLEGITSLNMEPDFIYIEFYHHLQSLTSLKDSLVKAGFPFKSSNKKPGLFKKFITNLGNGNKKSFGNKRLGCCDLEY